MEKKKTFLEDLEVTSVDLCNRGANPEAYFVLKKSAEAKGGEIMSRGVVANMANTIKKLLGVEPSTEEIQAIVSTVQKSTQEQEKENIILAMQESLCGIIKAYDLDDDEKEEMIAKSLDEFSYELAKAMGRWASICKDQKNDKEKKDNDSENDHEDGGYELEEEESEKKWKTKKELESEDIEMFDIEKMTQNDKAVYEALKKKYSEQSQEKGCEVNTLHPEVKKALEEAAVTKVELEELKKSLELAKLEAVAKQYQIIGKMPEELASKLYELQKSGGTAYHDYVAMLDEMVSMTENAGIFKEYGSNRTESGTVEAKLAGAVSNIMKSEPSLTYSQAVVKACDDNADLKAAYEGR